MKAFGSPTGSFSRERVAVHRHWVAVYDHPFFVFEGQLSEALQSTLSNISCHVRQQSHTSSSLNQSEVLDLAERNLRHP